MFLVPRFEAPIAGNQSEDREDKIRRQVRRRNIANDTLEALCDFRLLRSMRGVRVGVGNFCPFDGRQGMAGVYCKSRRLLDLVARSSIVWLS